MFCCCRWFSILHKENKTLPNYLSLTRWALQRLWFCWNFESHANVRILNFGSVRCRLNYRVNEKCEFSVSRIPGNILAGYSGIRETTLITWASFLKRKPKTAKGKNWKMRSDLKMGSELKLGSYLGIDEYETGDDFKEIKWIGDQKWLVD